MSSFRRSSTESSTRVTVQDIGNFTALWEDLYSAIALADCLGTRRQVLQLGSRLTVVWRSCVSSEQSAGSGVTIVTPMPSCAMMRAYNRRYGWAWSLRIHLESWAFAGHLLRYGWPGSNTIDTIPQPSALAYQADATQTLPGKHRTCTVNLRQTVYGTATDLLLVALSAHIAELGNILMEQWTVQAG